MPAARTSPRPPPPLRLIPGGGKAGERDFAGGRLSSDAGVVLLKDIDDQLGLTRTLATVLKDPRAPRRITFPFEDLLTQRVYQIVAGYEDANDANTLRDAPIFTLLLARLPATGASLASPPTLSRFENRVSRTALYRLARVLFDHCIASYAKSPQVIVLDGDDPEDRGHGQQEPARDDGSDGGDGFMPLHLYEGRSGRLLTPILKAQRFTGTQRLAVLTRLVKRLRPAWPHPLLLFRGDRHCAYPEVRQWIEDQPALSSVTGWTSHTILPELAREVVEPAQGAYERSGPKVTHAVTRRATRPGRGGARAASCSRWQSVTKASTHALWALSWSRPVPRCFPSTSTALAAKQKMRAKITNCL
jgi:DDE family transposase